MITYTNISKYTHPSPGARAARCDGVAEFLSIYPFTIYLSIYPFTIYLSFYLSRSNYLSIYLSTYLSNYLSIYPDLNISPGAGATRCDRVDEFLQLSPSIYICMYQSIYLYTIYLSNYLSTYLYLYLTIYNI